MRYSKKLHKTRISGKTKQFNCETKESVVNKLKAIAWYEKVSMSVLLERVYTEFFKQIGEENIKSYMKEFKKDKKPIKA